MEWKLESGFISARQVKKENVRGRGAGWKDGMRRGTDTCKHITFVCFPKDTGVKKSRLSRVRGRNATLEAMIPVD